jgi:hypothetical protein
MSKEQLDLIDLIVKERKEIEFLKEQLKQVEYDYHKNLVKLYDSVGVIDKEEAIEKQNCKILDLNKHRKIKRGVLFDED